MLTATIRKVIEPTILSDFSFVMGPFETTDFFDVTDSAAPYVDFLLAQHPSIDPARIRQLRAGRRPDILSNRRPSEWYEVRPQSIDGAIKAWMKSNSLIPAYAERGLPYRPGTAYTPSSEIPIGTFFTPEGETLGVVVAARRAAPGLIFWTLCIKGDYVRYFNRVRLVPGILTILSAVGVSLLAGEDVPALATAVAQLAAELSAGALPTLAPQ